MAYFTDPMADEFRKAIEDMLKESGDRLEDKDATKRAAETKKSKEENSAIGAKPTKKRRSRRIRKKFSPKMAKSLR
jgi:hypothetical protein